MDDVNSPLGDDSIAIVLVWKAHSINNMILANRSTFQLEIACFFCNN